MHDATGSAATVEDTIDSHGEEELKIEHSNAKPRQKIHNDRQARGSFKGVRSTRKSTSSGTVLIGSIYHLMTYCMF
jgi:hypothetical protein